MEFRAAEPSRYRHQIKTYTQKIDVESRIGGIEVRVNRKFMYFPFLRKIICHVNRVTTIRINSGWKPIKNLGKSKYQTNNKNKAEK